MIASLLDARSVAGQSPLSFAIDLRDDVMTRSLRRTCQLLSQKCILSHESLVFLSEETRLLDETSVVLLELLDSFFQEIHVSLLSISGILSSYSILQLPSHQLFISTQVIQPLSFPFLLISCSVFLHIFLSIFHPRIKVRRHGVADETRETFVIRGSVRLQSHFRLGNDKHCDLAGVVVDK